MQGDENILINLDFLKDSRFSNEDRQRQYSDEEFINLLMQRVRCLNCDHYFNWAVPYDSDGECWNCGTKYEVHEEENHWGSIEHGGEVVTVIDPEDRENTVRLTGQGGEGWAIADYLNYIGLDPSEFIHSYL